MLDSMSDRYRPRFIDSPVMKSVARVLSRAVEYQVQGVAVTSLGLLYPGRGTFALHLSGLVHLAKEVDFPSPRSCR